MTVRCWLVDRDYDDKGLIRLTYATTDGEQSLTRERAAVTASEATAAIEVDPGRLQSVSDDDRIRYSDEASRMKEQHGPDDVV